MRKTKANEAT